MPDSLFALVVLALVGIPGYVFTELRRSPAGTPAPPPGTGGNLETVFFGFPCALGGLSLSLYFQQTEWRKLLGAHGDTLVSAMRSEGLRIVLVAFLGALLAALLLAGLFRCAGALGPDPAGNSRLWADVVRTAERRPWLQPVLMVVLAVGLALLVAYVLIPIMRVGN